MDVFYDSYRDNAVSPDWAILSGYLVSGSEERDSRKLDQVRPDDDPDTCYPERALGDLFSSRSDSDWVHFILQDGLIASSHFSSRKKLHSRKA
jgi:hypothetical protein